jgi:pimeloyl-ACP methyl ester carboxylesterase
MRIRNGEVELNVIEDGSTDAPPLLLLHGITGTTRTWDWLVPHLTDRYRVLRLDFRGHGSSDRSPGKYSMQEYVSDAIAVCEHVGKPCIVLGHSLGGATAAALAQQRPDLVKAVILEDPPLAVADPEALRDNTLMAGFQLMRQTVPFLQEQKIPAETVAEQLRQAPSATGPAFAELLHQDAIGAMAAALLEVDATVLDPVLEGRMEAAFDPSRPIPVPTLVIAGDSAMPDTVARTAHLEALGATTPDAQVRVISGAGHLIHDELAHRDEFADAVRSFLATV